MKRIMILIGIFSFFMTGCATFPSGEVSNLKSRVGALEERQAAIERSVQPAAVDAARVPETRVSQVSSTGDAASMTEKDIQTALKKAGYYTGAIDGKLGPQSLKAITDFQSAKGLKVDGIVGPETRAALLSYLRRE